MKTQSVAVVRKNATLAEKRLSNNAFYYVVNILIYRVEIVDFTFIYSMELWGSVVLKMRQSCVHYSVHSSVVQRVVPQPIR